MRSRLLLLLALAITGVVCAGTATGASAPQLEAVKITLPASPPPVASFADVRHVTLEPLSISRQVASGRHWRIDSPRGAIHVWIPHGYAAATAVTVVYVHGYYTDVDGAWFGHQLPEQFALSGINAMFIVCEAPSWKDKPVAWPSLNALLATVRRSVAAPMPNAERSIVAVGHSGAFRTLDLWLANPLLDTVVLLDAAYGDVWAYHRWLLGSRARRLISVGEDTVQRTDLLHRALPETAVLGGFPLGDLSETARDARVLYIRSAIGHMPLVTAGIALPLVLRALRAKRVLTAPIPFPY